MTARATTAERIRFTIRCEPDNLIFAALAAEYGFWKMPHKDAIVVYGGVVFYVQRTRTGGISVQQEKAAQ